MEVTKMLLVQITVLLFHALIRQSNEEDNSTVEVPLLDNEKMPLVAMFDTTNLNRALKNYINDTEQKCFDEKIPEIKATILEDIGYEPGRTEERPAFTASITTTKSLAPNEIITFDQVWLNNGEAYDPNTGVFTVPTTGLYFISNTVMASNDRHLHCHLWKNETSNVGSFGTDYSSGTVNTVMVLKKADRIYLKHDDNRGVEPIYGNHWSIFSGYLISEG